MKTMTLGQAIKGARKPSAPRFAHWLDLMLKTKSISPAAEAQRAHDVVAVGAMRSMLAARQSRIEAAS